MRGVIRRIFRDQPADVRFSIIGIYVILAAANMACGCGRWWLFMRILCCWGRRCSPMDSGYGTRWMRTISRRSITSPASSCTRGSGRCRWVFFFRWGTRRWLSSCRSRWRSSRAHCKPFQRSTIWRDHRHLRLGVFPAAGGGHEHLCDGGTYRIFRVSGRAVRRGGPDLILSRGGLLARIFRPLLPAHP